jgi:hypothetical protein
MLRAHSGRRPARVGIRRGEIPACGTNLLPPPEARAAACRRSKSSMSASSSRKRATGSHCSRSNRSPTRSNSIAVLHIPVHNLHNGTAAQSDHLRCLEAKLFWITVGRPRAPTRDLAASFEVRPRGFEPLTFGSVEAPLTLSWFCTGMEELGICPEITSDLRSSGHISGHTGALAKLGDLVNEARRDESGAPRQAFRASARPRSHTGRRETNAGLELPGSWP